MLNLRWLKPASISVSLVLTILSLCGVIVLMTPDVTVPDGFIVVIAYTILVIACSITGRHKASVILGSGGIMAAIATWLMLLLISRKQLLSWQGKPVGLVALGIAFICSLFGAAVSFAIIRSIGIRRQS